MSKNYSKWSLSFYPKIQVDGFTLNSIILVVQTVDANFVNTCKIYKIYNQQTSL